VKSYYSLQSYVRCFSFDDDLIVVAMTPLLVFTIRNYDYTAERISLVTRTSHKSEAEYNSFDIDLRC
jgi:hypothetical protein